tara:strand:- start:5232 stop:5564 length:333 start_codon:yes stop_codon:yes gene_type:complete
VSLRFDRPHWLRQRDGSRSRLQPLTWHPSSGSISGKIVFDAPRAAQRLRQAGKARRQVCRGMICAPIQWHEFRKESYLFVLIARLAAPGRWIALKAAATMLVPVRRDDFK